MGAESSTLLRVSRRDFLKFCGWVAGAIGLHGVTAADVAEALESAMSRRPVVVWSSFQVCTGCAVSLLQTQEPGIADLILKQISLDYQDNVMAAAGSAAEQVLEETIAAGDFYWVVEGSVPTTMPEAMMIAGKTGLDIVKEIYPKAKATIAIGNCSSNGNIQAARPNPTGAKGIAAALREDLGIADPVVINMTRCPGNGEDLVAVLVGILITGQLPELDSIGRPLPLYGTTIHDNCTRRGHFDAGRFAEEYGDEGWALGYCLYKVGCKGPQTYAPCGTTRWNGDVSWCIHNAPCTGCAEPNFWDDLTPFNAQLPGVLGVTAEQIGIGLGIATAVGIGAHAIGQIVTGRFGKGGPPEEGGEH
ncbi:MAG: hydrogenase small subunit [Coriobacteriia bacterium]